MIGRARYNMLMTVDNDDKYPFVIDRHNNINNSYSAVGQPGNSVTPKTLHNRVLPTFDNDLCEPLAGAE